MTGESAWPGAARVDSQRGGGFAQGHEHRAQRHEPAELVGGGRRHRHALGLRGAGGLREQQRLARSQLSLDEQRAAAALRGTSYQLEDGPHLGLAPVYGPALQPGAATCPSSPCGGQIRHRAFSSPSSAGSIWPTPTGAYASRVGTEVKVVVERLDSKCGNGWSARCRLGCSSSRALRSHIAGATLRDPRKTVIDLSARAPPDRGEGQH